MKNRASNTRNLFWAVGILLCLVAMLVALIFAMSQKNTGNRADGTLVLGHIERGEKPVDVDLAGLESTANQLMPVPETKKGNLEDVFGMTFLLDKTLMGLRSYVTNYGDGVNAQIWTDDGSGLMAKNAAETPIVFVDNSLIRASDAAMITRPKTLVIYLGGDGLADTTQQEFVDGYTGLIQSLRSASPNANIVVCSIASISSNYQGSDGLTPQLIWYANQWIKKVCVDTGVYYADLASFLNDESGYLSDSYLMPDGRSIAAAGIALVVDYFRFHSVD
jgi:hypothetical protein